MNTITETADTSPERAIAEVRALLGADYDLIISALANAPYEIGPPRCSHTATGPDQSRLRQEKIHAESYGHRQPASGTFAV